MAGVLLLHFLASLASASGRKNHNSQQYLHVIDPETKQPIALDGQQKEFNWLVAGISACRLSTIKYHAICRTEFFPEQPFAFMLDECIYFVLLCFCYVSLAVVAFLLFVCTLILIQFVYAFRVVILFALFVIRFRLLC